MELCVMATHGAVAGMDITKETAVPTVTSADILAQILVSWEQQDSEQDKVCVAVTVLLALQDKHQ